MYHRDYEKNLKRFNKNYHKLRKWAIKDDVYSEKEGRALMGLLDALDGVLDEHDQMLKKLKEEIDLLNKK